MGFCLSHESAAAYWCWARRVEALAKEANQREADELANQGIWDVEPAPLPQEAACCVLAGIRLKRCMALRPSVSAKEVRSFAEEHELSLPLHIIVSDQVLRQKKGVTVGHAQAFNEEDAPFYIVSDDVNVVSPSLALLQLGRDLNLTDWLLLAYEFCGTYTLDPSCEQGFRACSPLTSVEEITQAAENLPGMKGVKNVRKALKFLRNGSASPMETALALSFALPRRLNGFGLGETLLNTPVELGKKARALYPRNTCRCDLLFPSKKVGVEYDSDAWHSTEAEKDADALRRVALITEGIEVVPVVFEQVESYEGLEATAALLAKKLRLAAPQPADEKAARALAAHLFGKHAHPWE